MGEDSLYADDTSDKLERCHPQKHLNHRDHVEAEPSRHNHHSSILGIVVNSHEVAGACTD